jgi:hypothetical protein
MLHLPKRPGRETDHSLQPNANINAWSHTSTPSCVFVAWSSIN